MPKPEVQSLSWGDAIFLYLEREGAPLHIASVNIFEGRIPLASCRRFIASKLPLIPRYRQRVVTAPFNIGLPTWEYDPDFDIRNHIREVKLRHGTEAELQAAAGKLLTLRMDRRHHIRMAMAEQQCAVAAEIIDINAAVHIPFARPLGARDVDSVRLDIARIVRDPGGKQIGGAPGALGRARRRGAVGGDDRRVGGQRVGHRSAPRRRVDRLL